MSRSPAPPPKPDDARQLAALLTSTDLAAAEAQARAWTERRPQHAAGWAVLATLLQRQGRHDEALAPLRHAVTLAPTDVGLQYNLGNALRRAGRPDEAAEHYRRALALQPDHAKSHYSLANVLRDTGRLDEARRGYQLALRIAPDHAEASLNLGNTCLELGLLAEAEAAYRRAAQIKPDWATPHFNLHARQLAAGRTDAAIDALRAAHAREPHEPRHAFFLGLLLDHAGRGTEALPLFDQVRHGPPLGLAWLDAWQMLRDARHHPRPLTLCGSAIQTFQLALGAARPDGLVLEFGVRWGKSIRQLAALVPGPVHGFDSFEGLPEAWHHEPRGSYSTGGQLPEVPPNVTLHRGWFNESLPPFLLSQPGPLRLANIDCDLYSSTATVLSLLAGRVGPGTVLVFDEYIGKRGLGLRIPQRQLRHQAGGRAHPAALIRRR
ncbi:tetratricopeptide repeat protein [Aquabacterium sp.]|uniref:tetratricopeptide repeat protein n=1 Tax=Aquabacterium sp. TaxID=1872578 RepID=UPI003782F781